MKREILIVGEALREVVDISLQLDAAEYSTVIAETTHPFEYLLRLRGRKPDGLVVWLTGTENVADFHELLSAYPGTHVVFLSREFPPHAAVARVVARHRATILRAAESALVIVATLVSVIYQSQPASV